MEEQYNVFLSHNRYQKEWVRQLAATLRAGGLRVFIDDDIEPGRNISRAIGEAIDRSRYVVLVLSPSSVRSKWVGLEMAIAVAADPAASQSRLVPVLLERVDKKDIPAEIRILNQVDLTRLDTRDVNLRRLLEYLGSAPVVDSALPVWPTSTLRVFGMEEVERWGWSGEDLVRALVRLDDELYGGSTGEVEELVARWTPMFVDHPESWRIMVDAPSSIMGYWHFVTLFEEDFERATRGELLYSQLTPAQVQLLELPGSYTLYFSGIGIRSRYRTPPAFKMLFESLLQVIASLAAQEIYFTRVCANGYTDAGIALCRSLGLTWLASHFKRGEIYYSSSFFADVLQKPIFKVQKDLIPLYQGLAP